MTKKELNAMYEKSVKHVSDLQDKIIDALSDDSFKVDKFKELKDELDTEKVRNGGLLEQLNLKDEAKKSTKKDDEDQPDEDKPDTDDKCKKDDTSKVLDAIQNLSNQVADGFKSLSNQSTEDKVKVSTKDTEKDSEKKEQTKVKDEAGKQTKPKVNDKEVQQRFAELESIFK